MYRRFVSRVLLLARKQTLAFGDCTTADQATEMSPILLFCHQSVTNQLIFVTNRVTNCSEALKHTTNHFIDKIHVT